MTFYHYAVLEKPEMAVAAEKSHGIDMEDVDYKRQPVVDAVAQTLEDAGGFPCGMFRGGMFGLATNQIAVFSAWDEADVARKCFYSGPNTLVSQICLEPTVRPLGPEKITMPGIYVIRWIRMATRDIKEYTNLCLETWPAFESAGTARCWGVFRPLEDAEVSKILMLTWYATLSDWEQSRNLNPADVHKWARRSELELSHWAEAGRLVVR